MTTIAPQVTGKKFLSDQGLAARYNCSARTIKRWKKDPKLKFPKPDLVVYGREYREETNILSWERDRIAPSD